MRMPIPPTAASFASTQNSVTGSELITDLKKMWASSIVYGCGKRSRNAIQTLRLFACLASDSASSSRHGRIVHRFKVICIVNPDHIVCALVQHIVFGEADPPWVKRVVLNALARPNAQFLGTKSTWRT